MMFTILKLGDKGGNADASCYPDLVGARESKIKLSPWPFNEGGLADFYRGCQSRGIIPKCLIAKRNVFFSLVYEAIVKG